jgi:flagellar motor switch protein FliN/FliY
MPTVDNIEVEVTVLIGDAEMALQHLLSLTRGAVIPLGGDATRPLAILANGRRIAEASVLLNGERVNVVVGAKAA